MDHVEARKVFYAAFRAVFMRDPTRSEVQLLQAVGYLESGYAAWWQGAGKGSNNMGAIQRGHPPCNPQTTFEYTDTSPNSDGTSTPYRICFARYATPEKGAEALAVEVYKKRPSVLAAATAGDTYGFSAEMRRTRYYEGFGRTQEARIANHHKGIVRHLNAIARANSEPLPDGGESLPETIRRGSRGEGVKDWQRFLGLVADGMFGPITERATKMWQQAKKLKADGIVGPKSWAAAMAEMNTADTEPELRAVHTGDTEPPGAA